MLLHLVMIAWMAPMVSAGAHCSRPFPGSQLLMQGVDMSTLDMKNLRLKRPVIDATCNQGKKTYLRGILYEFPDQVANWYRNNWARKNEDTRIIETMSDVINMKTDGVTVEGRYGNVSGGIDATHNEMQRDIAGNEYFYSTQDVKVRIGDFNLKRQPTLSEDAKAFLYSIGKPFKEAPEPYLRFIRLYGTHYFSSGSFGGVIHQETRLETSLLKTYSRREIKVMTRIAYNTLVASLSLQVRAGRLTSKAKTDFDKASHSTLNYRGGYANIVKDGMNEWVPTVLQDPIILSGNLVPISDLLKDQPKVQEQLELAVDSYYACAPTATSKARQPSFAAGIPVLCDTVTDGGKWIIIQRRTVGNVNFDRNWNDYQAGFGDIKGDHWLGLTNMHTLCNVAHPCVLRFDMVHHGDMTYSDDNVATQPGGRYFEEYSTFYLGNAKDKFRMHVSGPSGTAGDSLTVYSSDQGSDGQQFSTRDKDNDRTWYNSARWHRGAWWWNDGGMVNLNGLWLYHAATDWTATSWVTLTGYTGVDSSEIKVRRK